MQRDDRPSGVVIHFPDGYGTATPATARGRRRGGAREADSPDHHAIVVGTRVRTTALDRPVAGTVLVDNHADIVDNPRPAPAKRTTEA